MLQLLQGRSVRRAVSALALLLGAACAAAIACGGAAMKSSAPPVAPSAGAMSEAAPEEDPHVEIEQLDRNISADLARAQIVPPLATCSGATCATAMSEPFSTPTSDPACHPSASDHCSDVCTLSTSICRNQERICELAQHLPDDDWAANKCTRARASCEAAHDACCSCMQQRRQPPLPI
jgi:hypothetical protein